jgi:hypothetical protein
MALLNRAAGEQYCVAGPSALIGASNFFFFANLYLDRFDHFVTEVLQAAYVRYVDDFALFHRNPAVLAAWQTQIARFLEGRRLKLHPRKTYGSAGGPEPWGTAR